MDDMMAMPEHPLEPFMSSEGEVGVMDTGRPLDGSLQPEETFGATRAIISGGSSTPGLGSTPPGGTNSLSPDLDPKDEELLLLFSEFVDQEGSSNFMGIGALTLTFVSTESDPLLL